jgi:hypothetical protein
MSRRALSFIVGGLGTIIAFATLFGMQIMGSVLADARSEHIAGPGVDVFLRTPFPQPHSELAIEVVARGGSKAGVQQLVVREEQNVLAELRGRGVTWGSTIQDKERGSDGEIVRFALPSRLAVGDTLHLSIEVAYVCAMTSGTQFENVPYSEHVPLDVRVYSAAESGRARVLLVGRGLFLFALWIGLVFGVAFLFATSTGPAGDGQMEGIGLLMGLMGGGLLGYWFFARPLMAAWETSDTVWAVLLTALWVVLPLWLVWRWSKQRAKLSPYRLKASGRAAEVDARDLVSWLPTNLTVRARAESLTARRDKARMRVRWSGQRFSVEQLIVEATEVRLPLELAHAVAARVGELILSPSIGPSLTVDGKRTVDEMEREYGQALLAEAQRIIDAMRARRLIK